MAKKRSGPRVPEFTENKVKKQRSREILLGSFLMLTGFLLIVSFISYFFNWQADQSTVDVFLDRNIQSKNLLNKIGAATSHFFIYKLFGIASFIVPSLIAYSGYLLFFSKSKESLLMYWSWGISYILWITIALGFYHSLSPLLSGLVGYEINSFLVIYLGNIGLVTVLIFLILCILVIQWKLTPEKIINYFSKKDVDSTEEAPLENSLDFEMEGFLERPVVEKEIPLENVTSSPSMEIIAPAAASEPEVAEDLTIEVEKINEEESITGQSRARVSGKARFF